MKKILVIIVIIMGSFLGIWAMLTVNLAVTDAFNNVNYERQSVDYEKIKSDTGLDIETLCRDNSIIKTYDTEKGMVIVIGKYAFNLSENYIGKILTCIIEGINNINNNFRTIIK
ncbi:MAG: hypothetical protein ACRC57_09970 [Sarcina sp.]